MKTIPLVGLALIAGLALSCHRNSGSEAAHMDLMQLKTDTAAAVVDGIVKEEDEKALSQNEPPPPPGPGQTNQQPRIPAPVPEDWEKKIVRHADMTMQVKDLGAAMQRIKSAIQLNGGYVATSNEQQLINETRVDMTIKVPRERFEELLDKIQGSSDSLLQKEITSQDFTEEYVDTKARIRAKEKVRERYYDFLNRAKNIKEVLAVEADLRELDEEIESATGRTNYINHQSALSTIHLVCFQPLVAPVAPDTRPLFVSLIAENFMKGVAFLKEIILILVALWPVFLLMAFLVWIFKRKKTHTVVAAPVRPMPNVE